MTCPVRLRCGVLAVLLLVGTARADVYVSNLAGSFGGTIAVHAGGWRGTQFTTDASASTYNLDSVTLSVNSPILTGGSLFVALYSDAGSQPGTQIGANLTGNTDPTSGSYTYTAVGQSLTANTSYWVVVGVVGSGIYNLNITNDSPSGTWTLPARSISGDGGSSWSVVSGPPVQKLAIAATPVPEPAAYALLGGLGALGLAWRRHRRRG